MNSNDMTDDDIFHERAEDDINEYQYGDSEPDQIIFSEQSRIAREALKANITHQIQSLDNRISDIDTILHWIDRVLYRIQPPASGRIRIIWRQKKAPALYYWPKLVSWYKAGQHKNGRTLWRYRELSRPTRSVRGKGGFAEHQPEVLQLTALAQSLIQERSDLCGLYGNFNRAATQKLRFVSGRQSEALDTLIATVHAINAKGTHQIDLDELAEGGI